MSTCTTCGEALGFYGTDPSYPWIGYVTCEKCNPTPQVWTRINPAILGMLNTIMLKLLDLEEQIRQLQPEKQQSTECPF